MDHRCEHKEKTLEAFQSVLGGKAPLEGGQIRFTVHPSLDSVNRWPEHFGFLFSKADLRPS